MTVLQVADLGFGYGASKLFEGVTFSVALGDRVALVAPNGAGKSTLLRLVTGELAPDEGTVVVRSGVSVGYYRQSHELSAEGTVLDAFLSGFQKVLALRHALDDAQHRAASGSKEDLERLARATDEYHLAHGDELERKGELAERQQAFVDKTEEFIRKNIAGQKTKQAQSRRKMLEKLDRLDNPEDVWAVAEKVRFRFAPAPRTGDIVLDAKELGASRGERTLFRGL